MWILPKDKNKIGGGDTVILILVGLLGANPKEFEKSLEKVEIRRRIETIQITALLGLARILRNVQEI